MEVILKKGEILEVSFSDSEETFEISSNGVKTIIIQTTGWVSKFGEDDVDKKVIFYEDTI